MAFDPSWTTAQVCRTRSHARGLAGFDPQPPDDEHPDADGGDAIRRGGGADGQWRCPDLGCQRQRGNATQPEGSPVAAWLFHR